MTDELCDVAGAGTCGPLWPLTLSVDLWVRSGRPKSWIDGIKKAATLPLRPAKKLFSTYRAV